MENHRIIQALKEFNRKMSEIIDRQVELFENVDKKVSEKKASEIRKKINIK